jgi:glucuronosyltransferase
MLRTFVAAFFAFWLPPHIEAANILGLFPLPSISHQKLPRVLMKTLAERGHNVTFFTTDPLETNLTNLEQYSWHEMYNVFRQVNFAELKEAEMDTVGFMNLVWPIMVHQTDLEMKYPAVADLLASRRKFDVVIVEALGMTPFYAFAKHFKAPLIGITTLEAPDISHSAVGNFINPVIYPNFMLPYAENLNFGQRLYAVYVDLYYRAYSWLYINPEFDQIIEQHFGANMAKSAELVKSLDFLMYNSHPIFGTVRPTVPASVTLGFVHIEPTKPLPMDLEAYFRQSRKGVIYFSLGSNVRSADLSPARVKIICDVFRKLDYNVLWKWETDELNDRPENVKLIKWSPQQDVLGEC